ncbi:cytochrome-c peroxidase [Rubrivirga sp. IMCC43871]|uniref:cytochrome-c peroxidase n=1 Tax=Rubrivirga sp. IMCC43871 TaxID=3391575 RepID=UPI00398FC82C
MPHRFVFLLATALTLGACDAGSGEGDLDAALTDALATAGGADSFVLPAAADLAALPQDPRNPLTPEKVALGQLLFHETALAVNPVRPEGLGTYACSSCHVAGSAFQAGIPQGLGEGGVGFGRFGERRVRHADYAEDELDTQPIRAPSVLNRAYQDVVLWNGQFGATGTNAGTEARWEEGTPIAVNRLGYQGLETQAIAGLTVHRMGDGPATLYAAYPAYQALFDAAFPDRPAGARATTETAGLAIAAYVRTLVTDRAPFQRWLRGDRAAMTQAQKRGAAVFFGDAGCVACHNGPGLASTSFHALGMGELTGPGVFSDFNPTDPVHLGRASFTGIDADAYQFKTQPLYNLADRSFFGHGSSFVSVREVLAYKNAAVPQSARVPRDRLAPRFVPLGLTPDEMDDLLMFLTDALYDPDLARYLPEALPSGQCFPSNDAQTRADLGCGSVAARPLSLEGRGLQTGAVRR